MKLFGVASGRRAGRPATARARARRPSRPRRIMRIHIYVYIACVSLIANALRRGLALYLSLHPPSLSLSPPLPFL